MNYMQTRTQEERKAIAAKAQATRKRRLEAEDASRKLVLKERQEALIYAGGLREEIENLERRLSALQRMETLNAFSCRMLGKGLMRPEEIANFAMPWEQASGVYFLLDGSEVVYVGQAVNVFQRIGQHQDKKFDRYAYVPCLVNQLDVLESIYIHFLRPRLNANRPSGEKLAPISLDMLNEKLSITQG